MQKKLDKTSLRKFGEAFKKAREAFGLDQKQLGAVLGCAHYCVCGWETGRSLPSRRMWPAIKKEMGFDVGDFVREAIGVSDTGFGRVLYDIRSNLGQPRTAFLTFVFGHTRMPLHEWESGAELPTLRVLTKLEERLNDAPGIEDLRPAWEADLSRLSPEEQAYKRGLTPPKKEKPVKAEKPVEQVVKHEEPQKVVQPKVVSPVHSGDTRVIKVSLDRVIRRAETSGYETSYVKVIRDFLQKFADVVVGETYNHRDSSRNYLEIPWPLPVEPGRKRHTYVYRDAETQELYSTEDILDYPWGDFLKANGLSAVLCLTPEEETYEFFHK